jgi:hypothetical protein
MWLMPSYGRPDAPRKLLDAPGGMPGNVTVIVNADDPCYQDYLAKIGPPWRLLTAPTGSRFCEAIRFAFDQYPDRTYYGIIDDDYWPVTPGWYDTMIAAAGGTGVAVANNRENFPSPYTCRVMGGALARAIGTLAPGRMRHNFCDDTWARFAQDFGVYRPLEDVIVEHHHHLFGKAEKDETYRRGSADIDADRALYREWLNSDERRAQCDRVASLLGLTITATDFSKVRIGICVPMQDMVVDWAFHHSFHETMKHCQQKGINVSVFETAGGSHIGKGRERALWMAYYAKPECTHFLWIDDDMGWDASLVSRLVCADHEFCAAAGVKKVEELALCFNALPGPPQLHPVTKFLGARHVGMAFVMMKRAVIDKMIEGYPELRYNTKDKPPEWALFLDVIYSGDGMDRERLSEDYSFCQRWRDIGGEIWIDPDAALIHAGRKEYTGKPRDIMVAV